MITLSHISLALNFLGAGQLSAYTLSITPYLAQSGTLIKKSAYLFAWSLALELSRSHKRGAEELR